MLGRLLKRQIQPSVVYTKSGYVDSLGRVGRAFQANWSGTYVDTNTALGVPAIYRGVSLIADAIGALGIYAYRKERLVKPTPRILERPVPTQTRIETISAMAASLILDGNYFAVLGEPGANGLPDFFYPVSTDRVRIYETEGRLYYRIDEKNYDASEILHIKNFTLPGELYGRGIVELQKQAIGKEIAINEYTARYFDGGVNPTAVIKSANPDLTQEEADALKAQWMSMYSGRNRMPAVLNSSTEFEILSGNAQESQLVETQIQALTEAANILGLPAYYLGAPNSSRTYANVEQENLQLVRWSIQPIAERIEQALSDLLVRGQYARFDYDTLLRTDTNSRYAAYQTGITSGFLTVDEVRDMENRDPINPIDDEPVDLEDEEYEDEGEFDEVEDDAEEGEALDD
jgi:HK97 family phage portal protein